MPNVFQSLTAKLSRMTWYFQEITSIISLKAFTTPGKATSRSKFFTRKVYVYWDSWAPLFMDGALNGGFLARLAKTSDRIQFFFNRHLNCKQHLCVFSTFKVAVLQLIWYFLYWSTFDIYQQPMLLQSKSAFGIDVGPPISATLYTRFFFQNSL